MPREYSAAGGHGDDRRARPPGRPVSPLDRAFLTYFPGTSQVLLVRHGQQQWPSRSGESAPQDWVDPPLSETGRLQAEVVGKVLAGEEIDLVICSQLRRAFDTAQMIASHHGIEPEVHPELREVEVYRDVPAGSSVRDLVREPRMLGITERFVHERRWDVFPYSESSAEFRNRVVTLLEGAVAAHPGANIVVACHGGVINAWIGHLLGIDQDMFFRPGHASISRILVGDGRRVLSTLNETHHLKSVDENLVTF